MNTTTPKPLQDNDLQVTAATPERATAIQPSPKRGRPCHDYHSLQATTMNDIVYAASFYEGEGHYSTKSGVVINQNDREKLDWLQVRFGGKVRGPYTTIAGNDYYSWNLVRERALGFMFTIFTFLSKSRREQFRTGKRVYQQTISNDGISEAFVKRNVNSSVKRSNKIVKGSMSMFGVRK